MTEAEWNACTDPQSMLEFLRGKALHRKRVLFASACRRRVWGWMKEAASRDAVVVEERSADGQASNEEVKTASDNAHDATGLPYAEAPDTRPSVGSWYAARAAAGDAADSLYVAWAAAATAATADTRWDDPAWGQVLFAAWVRYNQEHAERFWRDYFWEAPFELGYGDFDSFPGWITERKEQAVLLRCIFGRLPFRPIKVSDVWLTPIVKQLAQAIYTDLAFDRLPILADALEDAGCTHSDILEHCRGPGPHVLGCWVVDLLTGRE